MQRLFRGEFCLCGCALACLFLAAPGCGTTRMSDTARTATEQLLISNAIDKSINEMDFSVLAGREVWLDATFLEGIVDKNYIVSSLRQQLLAYGALVKEKREEATYVVEARAGVVGTNRHEVLLGIPALQVPVLAGMTGVPSQIPEIPFAKTTDQKGVAKLAVFAYNQRTGEPLWQSGAFPMISNAKDTWVLGTGPFQEGTIYDSRRFAGSRIMTPFSQPPREPSRQPEVPVTAEAIFDERTQTASEDAPDLSQAPPEGGAPGLQQPQPAPRRATPEGVPTGYILRVPAADQRDAGGGAPRSARRSMQDRFAPPELPPLPDDEVRPLRERGSFQWLNPASWLAPLVGDAPAEPSRANGG